MSSGLVCSPFELTESLSLWTKYTVAGKHAFHPSKLSWYSSQCSHTWVIPIHHGVPTAVLLACAFDRVLDRILWDRTAAVDEQYILLCPSYGADSLSKPGLRLEIVRELCLVCCTPGTDSSSSYRRTYMPSSYHIAQELQKYNIPDYRPRQEQCVSSSHLSYRQRILTPSRFQKAIKKVRATQRMRRNRGFAFSQTETGGKQDQAKLIRAYDTSKSDAKPTGY